MIAERFILISISAIRITFLKHAKTMKMIYCMYGQQVIQKNTRTKKTHIWFIIPGPITHTPQTRSLSCDTFFFVCAGVVCLLHKAKVIWTHPPPTKSHVTIAQHDARARAHRKTNAWRMLLWIPIHRRQFFCRRGTHKYIARYRWFGARRISVTQPPYNSLYPFRCALSEMFIPWLAVIIFQ